jgi:hypothetical protein
VVPAAYVAMASHLIVVEEFCCNATRRPSLGGRREESIGFVED